MAARQRRRRLCKYISISIYRETIIFNPKPIFYPIIVWLTCVAHEDQARLNENWLSDTSSGQLDREEGSVNT